MGSGAGEQTPGRGRQTPLELFSQGLQLAEKRVLALIQAA